MVFGIWFAVWYWYSIVSLWGLSGTNTRCSSMTSRVIWRITSCSSMVFGIWYLKELVKKDKSQPKQLSFGKRSTYSVAYQTRYSVSNPQSKPGFYPVNLIDDLHETKNHNHQGRSSSKHRENSKKKHRTLTTRSRYASNIKPSVIFLRKSNSKTPQKSART